MKNREFLKILMFIGALNVLIMGFILNEIYKIKAAPGITLISSQIAYIPEPVEIPQTIQNITGGYKQIEVSQGGASSVNIFTCSDKWEVSTK